MEAVETVKGKDFDRRLFGFLLVMNIIASLLSIPFANVLHGKPAFDPYKLIIIIPFQIIMTLFIFSLIISVGINLSVRYGFDEPFLKSFLYKRDYPENIKQALSFSFLAGIALGVCLMILSFTWTYISPVPSLKTLIIRVPCMASSSRFRLE